jgi:hypothetical protein
MHVARARISGNRPCYFDPYPCQELVQVLLRRTVSAHVHMAAACMAHLPPLNISRFCRRVVHFCWWEVVQSPPPSPSPLSSL